MLIIIKWYSCVVRYDCGIRVGEYWYVKIVNSRIFGGKLWVSFFDVLNIHFQFSDMILTRYIYANAHSININYNVGLEKSKIYNRLTMFEQGIEEFLDIIEVVGIIKNWGSSRRTEIDNMLKMSCRYNMSVDVVN